MSLPIVLGGGAVDWAGDASGRGYIRPQKSDGREVYPATTAAFALTLSGLTAAAPAAAANLVSFRFKSTTKLCIIKSIQTRITVSTASTAGLPEFGCYVARSFGAADTGGTAVSLAGNQNKLRTSLATSEFSAGGGDIRFATAGVLTAGTRTLDTYPLITAATSLALGSTAEMDFEGEHDNDYALILTDNEGVVFQNVTALTAGIYRYHVRIIWHEETAYG